MNDKIQSAISAFQTIQKACEACRLRVKIAPDTDPVHQMLEGMIEACGQQIAALTPLTKSSGADSAALLPAMKAVLSRHPEAINALVGFFQTSKRVEETTGIPRHQPLQEQVEWCVRKKATQITLRVLFEGERSLIESFPAHQLVGPNFTA